MEAGAIPRISSQATESILPIYTADQAPIDELLAANVDQ